MYLRRIVSCIFLILPYHYINAISYSILVFVYVLHSQPLIIDLHDHTPLAFLVTPAHRVTTPIRSTTNLIDWMSICFLH